MCNCEGGKSKEIRKKGVLCVKCVFYVMQHFFSINIEANAHIDASRFHCKAFDFNQNFNTPAKFNPYPANVENMVSSE